MKSNYFKKKTDFLKSSYGWCNEYEHESIAAGMNECCWRWIKHRWIV